MNAREIIIDNLSHRVEAVMVPAAIAGLDTTVGLKELNAMIDDGIVKATNARGPVPGIEMYALSLRFLNEQARLT